MTALNNQASAGTQTLSSGSAPATPVATGHLAPSWRRRCGLAALMAATIFVAPGCAPGQLTYDVIERMEDESCMQDWVSGKPDADIIEALTQLEERGVDVREGNQKGFAIAMQNVLLVPERFWEQADDYQAQILSHELVHYCQRDEWGAGRLEMLALTATGRLMIETPGYRQAFRTMHKQGYLDHSIEGQIERRVPEMRKDHWLTAIDNDEMSAEVMRIWSSDLDGE